MEEKPLQQILDRTVFETLFKEHFKELVFFAQRYVKDFDTSREVVQSAFVTLWEKRETLDATRNVKAYLASVIHNRCLNHLRDHKKFNANLLSLEGLSGSIAQTSDDLIAKETELIIQQAIDELPEKCREIFLLNRFEYMKYQEIADHLGISVKTVETQMSKALQHMRVRLADIIGILALMAMWNAN